MKYRSSTLGRPDGSQLPHVDAARRGARAQQLHCLAQGRRHAHLAGEAVARAAGQDPHRRRAAGLRGGREDRVGDLVLRAVSAVSHDQVDPVRDRGPGLRGGIPIPMRDADVPAHIVRAKDIVEDVQDRLVLARRRVDHHVHAPVRCLDHGSPPFHALVARRKLRRPRDGRDTIVPYPRRWREMHSAAWGHSAPPSNEDRSPC